MMKADDFIEAWYFAEQAHKCIRDTQMLGMISHEGYEHYKAKIQALLDKQEGGV